jgi:hypothetical protein
VWRDWNTNRLGDGRAQRGNSSFGARTRRKRIACVAALLLAGYFPHLIGAVPAAQSPTEYQVEAAYLFNFLRFIEWPGDPDGDRSGKWAVGFVGDTPVGDELTRLVEGKSVMGRELEVKRLHATDNLRVCNILFVSASERKRLPSILAVLRGSNVLTVGDMDSFIDSGGMIQFVVEDARVKIAIDVAATSRAHLKVSSKLLSLARVVSATERDVNN